MKRLIVSCPIPEYREKVVDFIVEKYGYKKIPEGMAPPWDQDNIIMAKSPLDYIVDSIITPEYNAELTVPEQLKVYSGFTHHIMVAAIAAGAANFKAWGYDAIYERGVRQLLSQHKVKQTVIIDPSWHIQQQLIGAFLTGLHIS